jgi:hypothetical protein
MDRVANGEQRTCPGCGARLPDDAEPCPNCGAPTIAEASALPESEPPARPAAPPATGRDTPSRLYLGVALGVALLLFAAVAAITFMRNSSAAGTTCKTADGQRVAALLQADAQRWDDMNGQAGSATSRSTLAPPLAQLRLIERDAEARQYPPCGQPAQALLVEMMDHTIVAYTTYMQQESDLLVTNSLNLAREKREAFDNALRELNGLPPLPTPTSPSDD